MNILRDIDSVMYYDNLEAFWKKYKMFILGSIVFIFAAVATVNLYKEKVKLASYHDTQLIFENLSESSIEDLQKAIENVKETQSAEILTLELAKKYKSSENEEMYEATLLDLNKASNDLIRKISIYMLAELYLGKSAEDALTYLGSVKIDKKDLFYPLIADIKAMALAETGKTEEALSIYNELIQEYNLSEALQNRINIKIKQLNETNEK